MRGADVDWRGGLIGLVALAVAAGCGGGSGDGTETGANAVTVSGTVTEERGGAGTSGSGGRGAFSVRATGSAGAMYETETDPVNGRFTVMLPADDAYVMGFEHHGMMDGEMHFAGFMVFGCGDGESDHFFLSGREGSIDLGTIVVRRDGGLARAGNNPLDQIDHDGDGIPDSHDPDMPCVNAGDGNHDGFYDDDMDHDGHHDDDLDRDGHHDCAMGGMMRHDGEDDDCRGPR